MRLETFVRADQLYVRVRCPRCGTILEGKKGSPLYCYRCGALLDHNGHVITVLHVTGG